MNKITWSVLSIGALLSLTNQSLCAQTRSLSLTRAIAQERLLTYDVELATENDAFSIYNGAHGKGFVIVSADENMPEVLGYSDSGYFDPDNIPPGLQIWMKKTQQTCLAVAEGSMAFQEDYPLTRANSDIEPLMGEITWGQRQPYNLQCPVVNGTNSVTGCSATAMAMLAKYYRYPEKGTGSISYTSSSKKLSISYDFESTRFDYDNMLNSYTYPDYTVGNPVNITVNKELSPSMVCIRLTAGNLYKGIVVYADTLLNIGDTFSGYVQLMLYNKEGEFMTAVGEPRRISELKKDYFYPHAPLFSSLPKDIADGSYNLYLASKDDNAEEWALVGKMHPVTHRRLAPEPIEVIKDGNQYSIGNFSSYLQYSRTEADAVAELMLACACAFKTDFADSGSGASLNDIMSGAVNYLTYDRDIFMLDNTLLGTNEMNKYFIEQLENRYPIYVTGLAYDEGSKSYSGHAFIADGVKYNYRGTPLFHINWGWDGMSNGYFIITNFAPESAGTGGSDQANYSDEMYPICGMKPEDGKDEGPSIAYASISCNKSQVSTGERISVDITKLSNYSAYTINGYINLYLVDSNNEEWSLGVLKELSSLRSLATRSTVNNIAAQIPSSIPSGTYNIIARASMNTSPNLFGRCLTSATTSIKVNNTTGLEEIFDDPESNADEGKAYDLNGREVNNANHEGIIIRNNKITLKK